MIVYSDADVFALGGRASEIAARMPKIGKRVWSIIQNHPVSCRGDWAYGGALYYKNKITVITDTHWLQYNVDDDGWQMKEHNGLPDLEFCTQPETFSKHILVYTSRRNETEKKTHLYDTDNKKWCRIFENTVLSLSVGSGQIGVYRLDFLLGLFSK